MKNQKTRMLILIGLWLPLGPLAGQSGTPVDLYIQPDVDARKIGSASLDGAQLGQPAPVMDEDKAALGWHYAEYTDLIEGYVQDAKIGKDLLPVEDAIIYSAPSTDSPVLGVYNFGEDVEILDTGAWWTIRVEMTFPVYFVLDAPPPLPPVTGEATGALVAIDPEPAAEPDSPIFDEEPPSQETRAGSGPNLSEWQPRIGTPDVLGQRYEGTFRKSKKSFGLFKPKAPFYLEGPRGKRIAWVDTKDIVMPGSLKQYLDKVVIVHGSRDLLSSKDWVIRANNMRMK